MEAKRAGGSPYYTAAKLTGLASVEWAQLPGTKEPLFTCRTDPSRPQSLTARSVLDLSSRKGDSPQPLTPKVMSFMEIVNLLYTIFSYCYQHVDF